LLKKLARIINTPNKQRIIAVEEGTGNPYRLLQPLI
jgi:hypothetical protein